MGRPPWALRLGEVILRGICRELPAEQAQDCLAEWSAELPAIWSDPALPRWRSPGRVLAFCLGQRRTVRCLVPPPVDDPEDMLRAVGPLVGSALSLALTSDEGGFVGEAGTFVAGLLAVVGVIGLRPRKSRRKDDSRGSG